MVATLLTLKLRLVTASLRRSTAALVMFILGSLYALMIAGVAALGLAAAGIGLRDNTGYGRSITVILGAVIVLIWMVGPIVFFGSDQTLDPRRFAVFPVRGPRLAPGLVLAGGLGVPGLLTAILALSTALVWLGRPAAILPAVAGGALGAVTALALSRAATTALSGGLSSRRGRDRSSLASVVLILGAALLANVFPRYLDADGFDAGALAAGAARVAGFLEWTPLGAPWALGADAADGAWGLLAAHLALACAYAGAAVWGFGRMLDAALVSPARPDRTGAKRSRGNAIDRAAARPWARPRLGPTLAVMARCQKYWHADPRYLATLPAFLIAPIAIGFAVFTSTESDAGAGLPQTLRLVVIAAAVLFLAVLAGYSLSADVAS
ncbi:MAG: hypothetical protein LBT54_05425, partial [Bifidobacteriaceae bacterium]|nr:hypothetical protein [Bifidobacteriaceae bacterium]